MFPQPSKMKRGKKNWKGETECVQNWATIVFLSFVMFFFYFPITLSYIKNIFKVFLFSWECGAVKGFLWRNYRQYQFWIYWSSLAVLRKSHWVAAPARISGSGAGLLKDQSLKGMHWLSNISKGDGFHLVTTLSDKKVYGENKAYPPHLTHTLYYQVHRWCRGSQV